jgi:hypothetical protein
MAVRIRVYPQNGMLGMNGLGMNGGAVSASTYYNSKLNTQKQVSSLQLGYERALANERIERARLEERMKNPYALGGIGAAAGFGGIPMGMPIGGMPMGLPMGVPMGGVPMGGVPMGGVPGAFAGRGQSNVTNQVSTGGASQSVTNSNVSNVSHQVHPAVHGGWGFGGGYPRFGGGGLISGLLGALI